MTFSEENYLKAIYHLTVVSNPVSNAIAEMMETIFSNGHAQEISRKDLVNYK
jgi:DtxR family Mn-dependent transcriptional regulator